MTTTVASFSARPDNDLAEKKEAFEDLYLRPGQVSPA